MSMTKEGARKAHLTKIKKYGEDYYKKIGSLGGKASTTGGFYANRELAKEAGRKGGIAKNAKKQKDEDTEDWTSAEEIHNLSVSTDLSE